MIGCFSAKLKYNSSANLFCNKKVSVINGFVLIRLIDDRLIDERLYSFEGFPMVANIPPST